MEFTVTKSSDYSYNEKISFETLPELIKWCRQQGNLVIIDTDDMSLEIYDEYRE
jgi:fructose-1-phosphate kinase PfkB-like protein